MIETVNLQVKKTIGFKIKGKLDDVTFIKSTAEIMDALDEGKCNLYMEIESVKGVTFEIVWDSIKLGLRHLGEYLNKIEKIAVVTDIKWIQMATRVENKLIPSIEEKVFSLDEKEEAKLWLSN